jgi:hypothetical protein
MLLFMDSSILHHYHFKFETKKLRREGWGVLKVMFNTCFKNFSSMISKIDILLINLKRKKHFGISYYRFVVLCK